MASSCAMCRRSAAGVVVGQPGAEAQLEANKQAFYNEFVTRPEFVTKYPSTLTNEQYVDALLATAGLTPAEVRLFVVNMTNGQENPPVVPTASRRWPKASILRNGPAPF